MRLSAVLPGVCRHPLEHNAPWAWGAGAKPLQAFGLLPPPRCIAGPGAPAEQQSGPAEARWGYGFASRLFGFDGDLSISQSVSLPPSICDPPHCVPDMTFPAIKLASWFIVQDQGLSQCIEQVLHRIVLFCCCCTSANPAPSLKGESEPAQRRRDRCLYYLPYLRQALP